MDSFIEGTVFLAAASLVMVGVVVGAEIPSVWWFPIVVAIVVSFYGGRVTKEVW